MISTNIIVVFLEGKGAQLFLFRIQGKIIVFIERKLYVKIENIIIISRDRAQQQEGIRNEI